MDDVKGPVVLLPVGDHAHSSQVTSAHDHNEVPDVKLDKVGDLSSGNVNAYSVIDSNERIRITNGTTIMGDKKWDAFRP